MSKPTHTPKTVIGPDGKSRTVWVRSPETEREMEKFRLGPLAGIPPLGRSQAPELFASLKEPALVVETPYRTARQIIRTRLDTDRSAHRVLNGLILFGNYYFASDHYREGFPQFKQLYLMFGYMELSNKLQHQIIGEILFTRYELGLHFWLLIPKSLGEMAAQWGGGFMNLQAFPTIQVNPTGDSGFAPLSTACPTAPPDLEKKLRRPIIVVDPSYQDDDIAKELNFDGLTQGDIKFQPRKKKNGRGGF